MRRSWCNLLSVTECGWMDDPPHLVTITSQAVSVSRLCVCLSMCEAHEHVDVRTSVCVCVSVCVYVCISNPWVPLESPIHPCPVFEIWRREGPASKVENYNKEWSGCFLFFSRWLFFYIYLPSRRPALTTSSILHISPAFPPAASHSCVDVNPAVLAAHSSTQCTPVFHAAGVILLLVPWWMLRDIL